MRKEIESGQGLVVVAVVLLITAVVIGLLAPGFYQTTFDNIVSSVKDAFGGDAVSEEVVVAEEPEVTEEVPTHTPEPTDTPTEVPPTQTPTSTYTDTPTATPTDKPTSTPSPTLSPRLAFLENAKSEMLAYCREYPDVEIPNVKGHYKFMQFRWRDIPAFWNGTLGFRFDYERHILGNLLGRPQYMIKDLDTFTKNIEDDVPHCKLCYCGRLLYIYLDPVEHSSIIEKFDGYYKFTDGTRLDYVCPPNFPFR